MPERIVHADADALAEAAAARLASTMRTAVAHRGAFHVALAGGRTPEALYRRLAAPDYADLPWDHCHVFFGDERCVPPDHPDSNYRMARQALLDHVPVPHAQVHRMAGEKEPRTAATAYSERLRGALPAPDGVPVLDLVLLGLGGDGHVASLFPDTAALEAPEPAAANWVPSLEAWRLTLTYSVLNAGRALWVLAAGEGKAAVVARALGPLTEPPLPVQRLAPRGEYLWLLDRAAAAEVAP